MVTNRFSSFSVITGSPLLQYSSNSLFSPSTKSGIASSTLISLKISSTVSYKVSTVEITSLHSSAVISGSAMIL